METAPSRNPYSSDVPDDEWAFVAPCLVLMRPDAPQRHHDLREVSSSSQRGGCHRTVTDQPSVRFIHWATGP